MKSEPQHSLTLTPSLLDKRLQELGVPDSASIAVAVSGGVDSLCLALLASNLTSVPASKHRKIFALTVDHGLRPEASSEADFVANILNSVGCDHITLPWRPKEKPKSNIQAKARDARYHLMNEWCEDNGVSYVLLAHHMDDLAETFLMRLMRGSGVYGLSAMPECKKMGSVTYLRPFLGIPKSTFQHTLTVMGKRWLEDPSNSNADFDRVKVRHFLASAALKGLDIETIAGTANRMRRTRKALDHYRALWLREFADFSPFGYVTLSAESFADTPEETILRGVAEIIQTLGDLSYTPRMRSVDRLVAAMQDDQFTPQTLGGVVISRMPNNLNHASKFSNGFLFYRELSHMSPKCSLSAPSYDGIYDIICKPLNDSMANQYTLGPLGEVGLQQLKQQDRVPKTLHAMPYGLKVVQLAICNGDQIVGLPLHAETTIGPDKNLVRIVCKLVTQQVK